ncbi:uncharacterized protein N7506_008628, partial [Penicillium brevicompactum]|uniref:uncharacterized protein n=1 Tax=Penicillium brevicompactum TaxID=5074 RepID=UPI0025416B2D
MAQDPLVLTIPFSYDGHGQQAPYQPETHELGLYNPKFDITQDFSSLADIQDTSDSSLPSTLNWDPSCQPVAPLNSNLPRETGSSQLWSNLDPFNTNGLPARNQYTHDMIDYPTQNACGYSQKGPGNESPGPGEELGLPSHLVPNPNGTDYSEETYVSVHLANFSKKDFLALTIGFRFRYRTSLKATTAMRSNATEIPVSYLNKGQTYHLTVEDSSASTATNGAVQYRTFVHVSFEQEHQRDDPAACWRLWQEGRQHAERKKRDLPPTAVQYTGQNNPQMLVKQVHLDGFAVIWTPLANNAHRCSIPIRLNFLSTDFTRLKGVRGDSVRLCVKTEQLGNANGFQEPEISYCNVKLFRDHGAERKMSNDITIIHRRMDRLKLQAADADSYNSSNKRKRNSDPGTGIAHVAGMKREFNPSYISPSNSDGSSRSQQQIQLWKKVDALRCSLQSSQPENRFFLRADPQDDPDLFSFPIPDEKSSRHNEQPPRMPHRSDSGISMGSDTSISQPQMPTLKSDQSSTKSHESNLIVPPVACFYVKVMSDDPSSNLVYRAIYPRERTVYELKKKIFENDPALVVTCLRVFYINRAGLKVEVDNKFVEHIPEGQDMIVECQDEPTLLGSTSCSSPGTK